MPALNLALESAGSGPLRWYAIVENSGGRRFPFLGDDEAAQMLNVRRLAAVMREGTVIRDLETVLDCSLGEDPADGRAVYRLLFEDCDYLWVRGGMCYGPSAAALADGEETALADDLPAVAADLLAMLAP